MTKHSIEIKNLHKSFGINHVLKGINLKVKKGESFVLMGGSGSGKSVLIKCITGLLGFDQGDVIINGQSLKDLSTSEKNEIYSTMSMLFQGGALFDSMLVWENIAFAPLQQKLVTKKDAIDLAVEKLKAVNLDPKVAKMYPSDLSGGMKKRVALARAIATNPKIIFFDEPTTGLDPITSAIINDLIRKCVEELGATAFTITHDMSSLRFISDTVALLHHGKILWTGTKDEMDKSGNPYVDQFTKGLSTGPFTDNNA